MADSPTNNFATWNPISVIGSAALSNGNLTVTSGNNSYATINIKSGKWYWETTPNSASADSIGVDARSTDGQTDYALYNRDGTKNNPSTGSVAYGAAYTTGDTIGIAFDKDNSTITFYKNGVSQGVAYTNLTSKYYSPVNGVASATTNFGQGGQSGLTYDSASGGYWKYAPPAGYKALSSANMISAGVSTISNPSSYFGIALYAGNGTSQDITSYGFAPDFVWVKDRTSAQSHALYGDGNALYYGGVGGNLTLSYDTTVAGDVSILGSVAKGSGTFMIDDPLDPKNMLLFHSFVESPDVLDTYDGTATLDAHGNATIQLPDYFLPLNRDHKILLSANSIAMPGLFVSSEIHRTLLPFGTTVFSVSGGVPNGVITWEVLGTRQDPFIRANPIIPVVEKTDTTMIKKGKCQFAQNCH